MRSVSRNISIGIVEDHPVTMAGISGVLDNRPRLSVTLQATSAERVLDKLERKNVDILLVDLHLPGMDGDELLPVLAEKHPKVKPIMLSLENSSTVMLQTIQAGARAFLTKTCPVDEMVSTVIQVHEQGSCIPDKVAVEAVKKLNRKTQQEKRLGVFAKLSDKHIECLRLTVKGRTIEEISLQMNKSVDTVKGYRKVIYKQSGCSNVAELVKYSISQGFTAVRDSPSSK